MPLSPCAGLFRSPSVRGGDFLQARQNLLGVGGPLFGIDPTGRTVDVTLMAFFRMANGRVVEMWEDYDEQGMRQQLTRPSS